MRAVIPRRFVAYILKRTLKVIRKNIPSEILELIFKGFPEIISRRISLGISRAMPKGNSGIIVEFMEKPKKKSSKECLENFPGQF